MRRAAVWSLALLALVIGLTWLGLRESSAESIAPEAGLVAGAESSGRAVVAGHPSRAEGRLAVGPESAAASEPGIDPNPALPEPGAVLTGFVRCWDGRPASGVHVVASAWGRAPSPEQVERAGVDPKPGFRIVTSAADGSFAFDDLRPRIRYTLEAAGMGFASRGTPEDVHAGDLGVVIVVDPIYGVRLDFEEDDGSPIRTNPLLWGQGFNWVIPEQSVDSIEEHPLFIALNGVPSDSLPANASSWQHWPICCLSEVDDERLGPVLLDVHVPGYEPLLRHEVHLSRIRGELRVERVRLTPRAQFWGAANIRFVVEEPGSAPKLAERVPQGLLYFGFESSSLGLEVGPALSNPLRIDGIPAGDYRLNFSAYGGFLVVDPERSSKPIAISRRDEDVTLELVRPTTLELTVTDIDGTPYTDELTLEINCSDGSLSFVTLTRAPYRVEWLEPGETLIEIFLPEPADKAVPSHRSGNVVLVPGESASLVLRL